MDAIHVLKTLSVSFLVTAALMLVLRPLASALGLIDRPGGRKTHSGEIPVIGGIAIYLGGVLAALIAPVVTHNAVVLISVAGLLVLVGSIDDRLDLNPMFRLLAHLVAALVLVIGTGYSVPDLGDLFGLGVIKLGAASIPFTVVACMALINAFNMLDGMDGLAGGTAIVAFAALISIAVAVNAPGAALVCAMLTGSIAGFLLFNLPARYNRSMRTFMGDAGSTLLGFMLAAVSLVLVQDARADMPPAAVLWVMPIPIFELFTSTARRLLHGLSPMQADNGHFHHRLLAAGFSVRLIFIIYIGVSIAGAVIGLSVYYAGVPDWLLFIGFIALYAAWLLMVRYSEALGRHLPTRFRRELENLRV